MTSDSAVPQHVDIAIIGGGIVGCATAWQLSRITDMSVAVIEKEAHVGVHQTGHNSGVVHAGVYYKPGSLKATFCKAGNKAISDFCAEHGLPFVRTGKLLVATNAIEHERMLQLAQRIKENELAFSVLDEAMLRDYEPNVTGVSALHIEDSAITDYQRITATLADRIRRSGNFLLTNTTLVDARQNHNSITLSLCQRRTRIKTKLTAQYVVGCPGLQADRVAQLLGIQCDFRIIPFRGDYYKLPIQKKQLVRHLIYPIPDPSLPFLGVHVTRMIDGNITVGPNAVWHTARERYTKYGFNARDTIDALRFRGFWQLVRKQWHAGVREWRQALSKHIYVRDVQKYCPSIQPADLLPYPPGIRAQAVNHNGVMIDDFHFVRSERALVVGNAPSPAATSSLPIGEYICQRILSMIKEQE